MISLLRSEIRRLSSRRLVRILGALALLLVLIVEMRSAAVSDRAAAARQPDITATMPPQQIESLCQAMTSDEGRSDVDCAGPEGVDVVRSRLRQPDPRLRADRALPQGAEAIAVGVAILAFLVGASYVGADWHAGTMQALLFWETRRWRVLVSKAVALVLVVIGFAAVAQAVTFGLTYAGATTRGTTEGVTSGLVLSTLLTMGRGMVVVAVTALLWFGVAGLARVTGAALGAAFVYFVILENLLRGLRPAWQRFLFSENVSAVLFKHMDVANSHGRMYSDDEGRPVFYVLSGGRGALTLAVYLGLLLGVFYATFTRRDVT